MPFHTCFIGVAAFLQASIVEFTTEIEHPIQVVCRGFVGRESILVGFDAHGSLGLWKETGNSLPVSHCYIPLLLHFLQNGQGQRFGSAFLAGRRSERGTEIVDDLTEDIFQSEMFILAKEIVVRLRVAVSVSSDLRSFRLTSSSCCTPT